MKKSIALLSTSIAALSVLLLGCATPMAPSRYVELKSLSGYDIQSIALGLVHGKLPTTVKEKASIATFFTPNGAKRADMLIRLGRSKDEISNEFANIYDTKMKDEIKSWYGVGFTYKTKVVIGYEADIKKIYTNNKININMAAPLLADAPYTRDRRLSPNEYTEDEASAAKFRIIDRTNLPIERQLESKYSGVEGTEDWYMWQIAIDETVSISCKADYPRDKVEELISQGARSLRVEVSQSSTLTPFLRKRRSGEGPLLAFKVIDPTCEITKISSGR